MTEYVLTPQNGEKVIYGVLHADSDHDAGMAVLRAVSGNGQLAQEVFFHKAIAEASRLDTDVDTSDRLIGRGWFELAPTEPLPGGQPGGERQDGDALSRRFALKRPDGTWAVVTRWVYLVIPLDEPLDSDARVIEVTEEFVICKDLRNMSTTEIFGYEYCTGLPYEPVQANVRRESVLFFPGDIVWDGEEFTEGLLR